MSVKKKTLLASIVQPVAIALAAWLVPSGLRESWVYWACAGCIIAAALAADSKERSRVRLRISTVLNWIAWGLAIAAIFGTDYSGEINLSKRIDWRPLSFGAICGIGAGLTLGLWSWVRIKGLRGAGALGLMLLAVAVCWPEPLAMLVVIPVLFTASGHYYRWDEKSELRRIHFLSCAIPAICALIVLLFGLLYEKLTKPKHPH